MTHHLSRRCIASILLTATVCFGGCGDDKPTTSQPAARGGTTAGQPRPPAVVAPPKSMQERLDEAIAQWKADASDRQIEIFEADIAAVVKSGALKYAAKVKTKAPDFALPAVDGSTVKLAELLKGGPVVLVWYRGGWSTYCSIYLHSLQQSLGEIRKQGATLVAVSPETPESQAATARLNQLRFTMASDRNNQAARSYGLNYMIGQEVLDILKLRVNLRKYNDDASGEMPLTATYVIDTAGMIRYAFVDADYRKRAAPELILKALDDIANPPAPAAKKTPKKKGAKK